MTDQGCGQKGWNMSPDGVTWVPDGEIECDCGTPVYPWFTSPYPTHTTTWCCPGPAPDCGSVPSTLYATASPNCTPGMPSPVVLSEAGGGNIWSGGATVSCGPPGSGFQLTLTCSSSGWVWATNGGQSGSFTPSSVSPFNATFSFTPAAGNCCAGVAQTFTITE